MSNPVPLDTTKSLAFAEVLGLVKSGQLEAIAVQVQYFNEWATFLSTINWQQVPTTGGGQGNPPPPPPKWPP